MGWLETRISSAQGTQVKTLLNLSHTCSTWYMADMGSQGFGRFGEP